MKIILVQPKLFDTCELNFRLGEKIGAGIYLGVKLYTSPSRLLAFHSRLLLSKRGVDCCWYHFNLQARGRPLLLDHYNESSIPRI